MIGLGLGGGNGVEQALTVVGLLGASEMESHLSRIAGAFDKVDESQSRASKSGVMLQRIGLGMTAGISGSMIALGVSAVRSANDVVESESLVATTFGSNTDKIKAWSEQRRKSLGVNSYDERRQAASFQNLFTAGGLDPAKAAKMSQAFTEMKDDLVSFYNVADPDTFEALQSGINGEAEPMRRFGIYLSEGAVQAYAYKNGIAAAGSQLTDFQKQQARAGFILDAFNKSKAAGDLGRTKDSPTNQLRRMQNERAQMMAELGMALVPIEMDVIKLANEVLPPIKSAVKWFSSLDETTRKWAIGLGLAAGPLTFLAGKGLTLAAAWKTLRSGGAAAAGADDATGGGSPLDDILGSAKDKAQTSITDWIKAKLGLGDEEEGKEASETGGMRVARMTVYAEVVNVHGRFGGRGASALSGAESAAGGAAGAAAAGARGRVVVAGGAAAAATGAEAGSAGAAAAAGTSGGAAIGARSALARLLFPAGINSNMGPHLAGWSGRYAAMAPSWGGVGAAAKAPGTWGIGLGLGAMGYEGLRRFRPGFAENHGNTFEASRNVLGRLTHGWDFARGQSNYDSQDQMRDASAKYKADVETTKKAAAQWAKKNGKTPAEEQAEYFRRLADLEENWSKQYAANLSNISSGTHNTRHLRALQKADEMQKQAAAENLDKYLHSVYPPDAFKAISISNGDVGSRRSVYERWAKTVKDKMGHKLFGDKSVTAMMEQWDKDHAPKDAAPRLRQDWNERTSRLAGMLGLGPANTVILASSRDSRDDTTTVTISARPSDREHRALRTSNRTPMRLMP